MSSTYRTTSSRRSCRRQSSTAIEASRDAPAGLGGEFFEKVEVVRTFRRLTNQFIDLVRVVADEDAPLVGLDPIENDRRSFGGTRGRILAKAALALGYDFPNVVIRQARRIPA